MTWVVTYADEQGCRNEGMQKKNVESVRERGIIRYPAIRPIQGAVHADILTTHTYNCYNNNMYNTGHSQTRHKIPIKLVN